MKKTNAILRIVLCAAVVVVLGAVLVTSLMGESLNFSAGDVGEALEGAIGIEAEKIQNLQIHWVSGDIHLSVATDGSKEIRVSVDGDKDQPAYWQVKGQTLILRYSRPTVGISSVVEPDKNLTIVVPADWCGQELDIETVSGTVKGDLLNVADIEVENVSAECLFESCWAKTVSFETVSGNVEYRGRVLELECNTVSADCKVVLLEHNAQRLSMEAVSGDLIVSIPEEMGYSASLDSVSGNIYSDFHATHENGQMVYGDGSCKIDAESVSGDIEIRKMTVQLTTP